MSSDSVDSALVEIGSMLGLCRQYWRSISILVLFLGVFLGIYSFLLPTEYRAKALIFPSEMLRAESIGSQASMLANMSNRLGINMLNSNMGPYLLYPGILNSRLFSDKILGKTYMTKSGKCKVLSEVLVSEEVPDSLVMFKAHDQYVKKCIRTDYDINTGITTIYVILPDPVMAGDVANDIVRELEIYVRQMTMHIAESWTRFIESRVAEEKGILETKEENLARFETRNRNINNSPTLHLEYARLQREVSVQQGVYMTLKQQQEIARIEAAKDVTQISVLDKAVPPQDKFSPHRTIYIAFGMLFGGFIGIGRALVLSYRSSATSGA